MNVCSDELREQIFNDLKRGKNDTLSEYYDNNPELKLYKYRSGAKRDVDALKESKVWMGCAAHMDDDYDSAFIPREDWIKLYQYMCSKEPKFKEERFARIMNSQGKVFQKEMYICSLAEIAQNEDLWTRYAADHSGFCIEYSAHALIRAGWILFPIFYGNIDRSIMDFSGKSKPDMLFDIILKKDKEKWHQQREWRIIAWYTSLGINPGDKGTLVEVPTPTKIYCGRNVSVALKEDLNAISVDNNIPIVFNA